MVKANKLTTDWIKTAECISVIPLTFSLSEKDKRGQIYPIRFFIWNRVAD